MRNYQKILKIKMIKSIMNNKLINYNRKLNKIKYKLTN